MKRSFIVSLIAISLFSFPFHAHAFLGLKPFGGRIILTIPCDEGLLLTIQEPLSGVGQYMWYTGNLPYLMYVVPHIGQFVLGMASFAPGICTDSGVSIGSGFPILYHGSGI